MQAYITTFMNPQVFGTARRAVEYVIRDGDNWEAYDSEKQEGFMLSDETKERAIKLIKANGFLSLNNRHDNETIYRRNVK